jgi:hypothetical protein
LLFGIIVVDHQICHDKQNTIVFGYLVHTISLSFLQNRQHTEQAGLEKSASLAAGPPLVCGRRLHRR